MNFDRVVFGFFILLALTLNFSFVTGDFRNFGNPVSHNPWMLFATIIVNIVATVLKFGDRTHIGAVFLATSLAALLQLIAAAVAWTLMLQVLEIDDASLIITNVVSLAGGALVANVASVVLLVIEVSRLRS
jgi:hypothetical protein